MSEQFDSSEAEMPFLLRFQEPGPQPIAITGRYDPIEQRWVHPEPLSPTARRTTYPTSHTTTQSTYYNQAADTNYDTSTDWGHD